MFILSCVITDGQRGTTVESQAKSNETMWPQERGTNQRKEKNHSELILAL